MYQSKYSFFFNLKQYNTKIFIVFFFQTDLNAVFVGDNRQACLGKVRLTIIIIITILSRQYIVIKCNTAMCLNERINSKTHSNYIRDNIIIL